MPFRRYMHGDGMYKEKACMNSEVVAFRVTRVLMNTRNTRVTVETREKNGSIVTIQETRLFYYITWLLNRPKSIENGNGLFAMLPEP